MKFAILISLFAVSFSSFAGRYEEVLSSNLSGDVKNKLVRYYVTYNRSEFECSLTSRDKDFDDLLNPLNMGDICRAAYSSRKLERIELEVTAQRTFHVDFSCKVIFAGEEERSGQCLLHWYPGGADFSYSL